MSRPLTFFTVSKDDDEQRMDRWVKKHVPDMPYTLAQKLMRKGQIRVDGKRVKPDTRLSEGQEIKIPPFETRSATQQQKTRPTLTDQDIAFMRDLVIFEDEHIIAINKPHGLAVQGGTKTKRHVDGLLDALKDKKGQRPRLVHRLDKETSGILLLAKTAKAARELGFMFKKNQIKKIYWAITTPTPEIPAGTIRAPLLKSSGNFEKMVIDEEEGKHATTEYAVIESATRAAAFTAFWPRTGRTHQIRVHAAQALGVSILGDGKYRAEKDEESKLIDADLDGLNLDRRLHLHARRVIMQHPLKSGSTLDITAPLPPELVKSWKTLGFNHKDKSDPFEDI